MAPGSDTTRFICLFHNTDRARAVVNALEQAGLARGTISTINKDTGSADYTGDDALTDLGVPERDLDHLQDGLRKGGVVVSLEASENRSDDIESIFHRYSADKIDEADTEIADQPLVVAPVPPVEPIAAAVPSMATDETVIPVAEEELLVGKREVDRGGVRVYRRTVEKPVQQDVDLHNERVVLEYREVNRPVTDADLKAGTQQIELVETAEVPVVQKVARVVEEVHVGKVESDRTEVVNDTVRHTEVEVDPVNPTDTRTRRE